MAVVKCRKRGKRQDKAFADYVACLEHGSSRPWVVCIHVADQGAVPAVARRLQDSPAAGEVLCSRCDENATADSPHLRIACESCVLSRFRLQDAS